MLHIHRLPNPAALLALTAEWDALDAALSPRLPFTSSLWNTLWWQHFREDQAMVRDEFYAHAVRDGTGALIAVVPLMLTHRPALGPLRMRTLQFFGLDPNLTETRCMACRPEHQDAVLAALVRHFKDRGRDWDWLCWTGLRHAGPEGSLPAPVAGQARWTRDVPDYFLPLPATWEELKASLPRNIKESLRKCYNSLKRDGHAASFAVVSRPEDVPAAMARFFELHAARAQDSQSVARPDRFTTLQARGFLLDYARHMAERGQLRIFQLAIAGTVVATRVGFVLGRELYLYYSGYAAEDWGQYSVMTTVVAETLKWAIAEGFAVVNLSTGTDVSKTRWRPDSVTFSEAVQLSPTRRGRLAYQALDGLRRHSRPGAPLGWLLHGMRARARRSTL